MCRRLAAHPWWRRSRRIAFYLPMSGEISPLPLLAMSHRAGKRCYAPALDGESLRFVPYRPGARCPRNRLGAPQPTRRTAVRRDWLDMALLPLLAYDLLGNRLGQGKGCYDRALRRRPSRRRPRLVGLAYADQARPELAGLAAAWDLRLDAVATERGVTRVPAAAGRPVESKPGGGRRTPPRGAATAPGRARRRRQASTGKSG